MHNNCSSDEIPVSRWKMIVPSNSCELWMLAVGNCMLHRGLDIECGRYICSWIWWVINWIKIIFWLQKNSRPSLSLSMWSFFLFQWKTTYRKVSQFQRSDNDLRTGTILDYLKARRGRSSFIHFYRSNVSILMGNVECSHSNLLQIEFTFFFISFDWMEKS